MYPEKYTGGKTMTECWRYGALFCNCFMIFGVFYFSNIPISLQNEMLNDYSSESNNTGNQTGCKVCLGLGEVRYNLLFSVFRWSSVAVCLPSGLVIDRLGNSRSVILFSVLPLIGSVMFAVGATSQAPVTTPMYIMMMAGYSLLAFGDGPLRYATFIALALSSFGNCGRSLSLFATPYIATNVGFIPSVWLAAVACGFGVMFAVVLACLLQLKTFQVAVDYQNNKLMTLKELWALPGSYWPYTTSVGIAAMCWLVKQANLPDFLKLRHGYTMAEASHITGISPLGILLSPFGCFVLRKIDCNGIMTTLFQSWMLTFYVLLGFFPSFNLIILAFADGICIGTLNILLWQVLVDLCPASYIGTLGGLMFLVRNSFTALTFIVSGYMLQRQNTTDVEVELDGYNHLFLMLVIMSSIGLICAVLMNILDTSQALNSRIARWRNSNTETIGLMSMTEPSSQYCGTDGINDNIVSDDSTTCKDD